MKMHFSISFLAMLIVALMNESVVLAGSMGMGMSMGASIKSMSVQAPIFTERKGKRGKKRMFGKGSKTSKKTAAPITPSPSAGPSAVPSSQPSTSSQPSSSAAPSSAPIMV
eukprot:CAMPEP_0172439290 /NCGR_PEP_ID=MMETSP1065-20121228/328_1 /TAXON_ID=265537 /ORGANISM="Amphiprora paludosa, Strain CCMP125" /LENGTH=110 /DNA_ID=CAMNT_0013187951 /DNA_START=68 /DNA_END=400 /DNA_ORIENTATION=+